MRGTITCLLALALLLPAALDAHPLAPSLLEFRELENGQVEALWKISALNPQAATLVPRLTPDCSSAAAAWRPAASPDPNARTLRATFDCSANGLVGRQVSIDGLEAIESSVLLRVELFDASTSRAVLRAGDPPFTIPVSPTVWNTVLDYLVLGFDHIMSGFDHLLFVLGLLFLIQGHRMLLWTVTAFTLGHSVTLSLATLDLVRLPSGPVELAIAVSIWVVALELARKGRSQSVWLGHRPWLVAGVFGLLHGFGFAGALAEAGLPAGDVPLALLSFNLGIELGQLAFIAAVILLRWGLAKALASHIDPVRFTERLGFAASYLIGILATYWSLERASQLLQ